MQRTAIIGLVLVLGFAVPVAAQSVGGGLSFWVPESLYLGRGGSVGVESAIGSSLGFGEVITVPFGIAYNKVYGRLEHDPDAADRKR